MRARIAGFLAGLLVALGISLIWLRNEPSVGHPALSECDGAIKTVEIQYARGASETVWPALAGFFDQIDPNVHVVAACGSSDDDRQLRAIWKWPSKLQTVIVGRQITTWSKDRFLVSGGPSATLLCPRRAPSAMTTRNNDAEVAPALVAALPGRFQAQPEPVAFDAGDILCDDKTAIFSDVLMSKNRGSTDLAGDVGRMTGLQPLWLHRVPEHHIGMFAAPLDGRTVVVGDPDLGRSLWTPAATKALGAPDFSPVATDPFRSAKAQFAKAGFKVIKAPIAFMAPQIYVTYTNAIFEKRGGRKIVYMPTYGIKALDDAGANAYRLAGWEVKPIPVRCAYRFCGTIGCLINVLERA